MPTISVTKLDLMNDARAAMTEAMRHIQSGEVRPVDEIVLFCNESLPQLSLAKILMLNHQERMELLFEFEANPDSRFGDNLLGAIYVYRKIIPEIREIAR